jgi:predicted nucleic acid-binding protein
MTVVVDSSIWSLALRRRPASLAANERDLVASWSALVTDGRVTLIGLVRQETLSGISVEARFTELRDELAQFPDEPVDTHDHVRAAEMFNRCRQAGVQGSPVDFLVCAVAERLAAPIFTTDGDFDLYAKHIPISLFRASSDG